MQLSDIVANVKSISKVGSDKDSLIKEAIEMGVYEASARDLPYLMTPGVLSMVAKEETGTVTATQSSATIAGSSTAFTSAMVGRKIRIADGNTWYRITAVASTTSLTIDAPYSGATVAASGYTIFKDEYRIAPDADSYKVFQQLEDRRSLPDIDATAFDILEPAPVSEGSPDFTILRGSKLDTDTTGTVSGTANNSTITGSGTSWLSVEGLAKGTQITISPSVYTVKSVDSDTQITVYEKLTANASAASYIILLDNLIIQFFQIPDEIEIIRYTYQRRTFPLINDEDIPDIPLEWHHMLVNAGLIWAWGTKDRPESAAQRVVFEKKKSDMWARVGHISKSRIYPRRSLDPIEGFPLRNPRYDSNVGPSQRIFR